MATSMGAVLLCAGATGKRTALKHSRVMIHQPLGVLVVKPQISKLLLKIQKLKNELYEIVTGHTGKSFDEVEIVIEIIG